jgi:hypothetical protein
MGPLSSIAHAQWTAPTEEELKMTSQPQVPGAAAVYLYREEITEDRLHDWMKYVRLKVLTERGKQYADVELAQYSSDYGGYTVSDIQGRTIHPDGTIIPFTGKPLQKLIEKSSGVKVMAKVFTLPDVEVGSIIEYRYHLRYDDMYYIPPRWYVQSDLYTRKAHYLWKPTDKQLMSKGERGEQLTSVVGWFHILPPGFEVKQTRLPPTSGFEDGQATVELNVHDVAPVPEEDYMPPFGSLTYRVLFYYTPYRTPEEYWKNEGKGWAKNMDKFIGPENKVKQATAGLVSPSDTPDQKLRKIYAAVMKLDNTRFSRKKSEAERKAEKLKVIKDAEDVWKQQSGSDDEIALLYVALARAAGLKVWPMQVTDRSRAIFDPRFLSVGQLDDYIAIVEIGGKDVYLDPGQKICPFGILNWKHAVASGFRLSEKGATLATTPLQTYKQASTLRIADLTIDPTGAINGTVRFVMSGLDAIQWRQLALENDSDEVKKQFNESMQDEFPDGVQADFDHFLGLDDYTSNLVGIVKVSGNIGTATGKRFFLPGLFFESRAKHPFVAQDKRATPVDVRYPKLEQDDVTYHLPPGYTVESTPQSADAAWPGSAMLKIKSTTTGDSVEIMRTLAYNFTFVDGKDYPNLHDFYQKVAAADQQQIVLTRTTVAKGN